MRSQATTSKSIRKILIDSWINDATERVKQFILKDGSYVKDLSNNLSAHVELHPAPEREGKGIFSKGKPRDTNKINMMTIKVVDKDGNVLVTGGGNYTSHIKIGNKVYWRHHLDFPDWEYENSTDEHGEFLLPSSLSLYEPVTLIRQKEFSEADSLLKKLLKPSK